MTNPEDCTLNLPETTTLQLFPKKNYFLSGTASYGVGHGTSAGVSSVASITDLNGAVLTLNGAITTWNTGNPTKLCNFHFVAKTPATDVPTLASGAPATAP